jgi:FkbM family methyltransferase
MNLKDKSDASVYNEIFVNKIYDKFCGIEADEIWIDLGGYIGLFSKYALSKGAKVKAIYEPFTKLNDEIKSNAPNVKIINKAVDSDSGIAAFYIHPLKNYQRNTLYNHYKKINMIKIGVEKVSFNDIVDEGDCVKMDIEGAELNILDNCKEGLRKLKKLVFEYHFDKDWNIDNYNKRIEDLKIIFNEVYYDNIKTKKKFFPSGRIVYCSK